LYSIFKKMQAKKLPFSEVFDVYGFRIIADTADTAYRTLGRPASSPSGRSRPGCPRARRRGRIRFRSHARHVRLRPHL
ncbi:MAG: hypothetical protein ACREWE_06380, partial [Gammaproteobacteria bacterium]